MTAKPYTKKHAEALIDAYGQRRWEISEEGLRPDVAPNEWYLTHGLKEERDEQSWIPATVFDGEDDAPDIAATPALPFPFDERDLAAFMLGGLGYFLAEFYGGLGDEVDEHALSRIDPAQNYARRAVRGAFAAYREAVERVGQPDRALAARMYEAHKAYRKARTDAIGRHGLEDVPQAKAGDRDERRHELDAEYQRRLALVEGDVSGLEAEMNSLKEKNDDAEKAWLRAMVAQLLKPVTGPAEPVAEPGSQVVPVTQPECIGPTQDRRYTRTGWKDGPAFDYAAKQFAEHGPFQAKALIASLKKTTDPGSPFEVRGGVLTVSATGQAIQDKTIENSMVAIRKRADKLKAFQR